MKKKVFSLAAIIGLSTVLTACGGDATATPPAGATNTVVASSDATPTTGSGTGDTTKRKVVVSSKDFTEEFLLGEMYALVLENAGVPVDRKLNLGASDLAHAAMLKGGGEGGIDLYPEYTSTGLTVILKKDPIYDPPMVYDAVKQGYKEQFKMSWLAASPLNDTQAFVTTKEVSDQLGIKSLTDLCAKASQIRVSTTAEFKDRPDAYPRLKEVYGACDFKEIKPMNASLFYTTLLNKDVEVTQAYSTDGPIAGNGLVLLADPKNYGLPYNVAPVVRDDVLAMYPQIADALNTLAPKLTNDVISGLNWEVDGKQREYADVAKEYLQKEGLIK
ncbi:MAG: glycine betaine ABC transporter substrate-binding protein [Chloroflexota bacterium]